MMDESLQNTGEILSVSQLNQQVRQLLEGEFPSVWVSGEISNFARPVSGHWYFSLKDQQAQVRCAMFQMRNRGLNFKPENGMQVLAKVKASLYPGRGDFQLIVEYLEEMGAGALQRAFEALKHKLYQEGLFDSSIKQYLPSLPSCIGVVTSPTGAAIRDILSVLKRRFAAIPVIIYPTQVQGNQAAAQIVRAIEIANQRQECEVLILARGGGSLEDLWPFNEEVVARAIYASTIPIVSGVGHEVDITIADFVADSRAPTPSVAAEMVSPDSQEWLLRLTALAKQLQRLVSQALMAWQRQLQNITARLRHPQQRLQEQMQRLDYLQLGLERAWQQLKIQRWHQLEQAQSRLLQQLPSHRLSLLQAALQALAIRLTHAIEQQLNDQRHRLAKAIQGIEMISPLATLARGYAIATTKQGKIIQASQSVAIGEQIQLRLYQGQLQCRVETVD